MTAVRCAVNSAVSVAGLHKAFGTASVLADVELEIGEGEFVALLGASGSGKTTLLRILAGIDSADAGEVWVPEVRTVVFQEPRLVPSKRVWRNVALGLARGAAARASATRALAEVGLADKAQAWPATLSGGQAQRVALARALVREPALLLLDEPFAALDALTRLRMHELIRQLRTRHHPATLLVTHDVDEAILLADRIAVLVDGRIRLWIEVASQAHDDVRMQLLSALGVTPTLTSQRDPRA
jgi:sulfonate transport system ATP-binding protein